MFPCTQCGLCCQNIKGIDELKKFDLGNGVCKYYDTATKQCKIYNNRPDICNIDKMYKKQYYKEYKKEEFYSLNANICNRLQENYNLDKSFRVKIKGD